MIYRVNSAPLKKTRNRSPSTIPLIFTEDVGASFFATMPIHAFKDALSGSLQII